MRRIRLHAAAAIVAVAASLGVDACKREAPPAKPDDVPAASTRASASKAAPSTGPKRSPVVQLSLGHMRACALRADGHVVCWGDASVLGVSATSAPRLVAGLDDAREIATRDGYGCALRRGGDVVCWSDDVAPAKPLSLGVAGVRHLADGVALLEDGHVVEIEMSTTSGTPSRAKPVAGLADVVAISHDATGTHCAIGKDATARCWGRNGWGEIPDGTTTERPTPVRVKALDGADEISIAYFFGGCARFGGKVKCWGGEWRKGGTKLEEIAGIVDAVEIGVEEYHACARLAGGKAACFGSNGAYQIDDGADAGSSEVRPLQGVTDAVQIALGGGEPCGGCGSTCVATKGGDAWCVGVIATGFGPYAWKPTTIELAVK